MLTSKHNGLFTTVKKAVRPLRKGVPRVTEGYTPQQLELAGNEIFRLQANVFPDFTAAPLRHRPKKKGTPAEVPLAIPGLVIVEPLFTVTGCRQGSAVRQPQVDQHEIDRGLLQQCETFLV